MGNFRHVADMDYIYFLNDPQGQGLIFFKCIKERHQYARSVIRGYLSDEGWLEDVSQITTGTVTHLMAETNMTLRPDEEYIDEEGCDGEGTYWGEWTHRCDHNLTPIEILKQESLNIVKEPFKNDADDCEPA